MNAQDVSNVVSKTGWLVKLEAGMSMILPCDAVYFEIAGDSEVHTLRHLLGREAFIPPMKAYLTALERAGSLPDGDRLLKMLEYLRSENPAE